MENYETSHLETFSKGREKCLWKSLFLVKLQNLLPFDGFCSFLSKNGYSQKGSEILETLS